MTLPNLDQYKIPVIEGINDSPEEPNYLGNGKGCNGAYFIDKFHGTIDELDGYFASLDKYYALYPEKTLPFVAPDPGVLTYGTYNLVADDFARTLSPSSGLSSGYTLAITIPSGLDLAPGLQTYFAVKGGCRVSLAAGAGVNLFKFDETNYLEPLHVWALICTGVNNYNLYRISAPKTQSTYGSVFVEFPKVQVIPLFTAPVRTTITKLVGLKVSEGTLTGSVQINGSNVTGLANLNVSSTVQVPVASGANIVEAGDRVTFNVTAVDASKLLEFSMAVEVG